MVVGALPHFCAQRGCPYVPTSVGSGPPADSVSAGRFADLVEVRALDEIERHDARWVANIGNRGLRSSLDDLQLARAQGCLTFSEYLRNQWHRGDDPYGEQRPADGATLFRIHSVAKQ